MYEPRWYRDSLHSPNLKTFTVQYNETDLWIGVNASAYSPELEEAFSQTAKHLYLQLAAYLNSDQPYFHSLVPYNPKQNCPPIAKIMSHAAAKANVGPMAAVAGAFSEYIGKILANIYPITDLIIENGGDIYLQSTTTRFISLGAGNSVLSNKLAIEIPPAWSPLGICTSSGTVGPSLSFGKADAVTILAKDTATADAYATAIGNMIKTPDDIAAALEYSKTQPGILGIVIIIDDRIGFKNVKLVKV